MGGRQQVEQAAQFLFRCVRNQLVDLFHGFPSLRVSLFHIQNQSLEEIHFCAVPEVIAPLAAGIFNNDVTKELCHQFVAFDFRKAGPGVRIFRRHQIENADSIFLVPQILAGRFIQFGFGIADNQRFTLRCCLEDTVDAVGSGFHRAAGAVYGDIPVEPAVLRHAHILAV